VNLRKDHYHTNPECGTLHHTVGGTGVRAGPTAVRVCGIYTPAIRLPLCALGLRSLALHVCGDKEGV